MSVAEGRYSLKSKRLASNMIANLVAFAVNMLVSFFLSPYIVGRLGSEAYGFVSMINSMVSMSQIVTIAFNSMGSRFITIAIHKGEEEKAQKYFSSLFYANVVMSVLILLVFGVVALNVNAIFDVPLHLVSDVRVSFIVMAVAFCLSLVFSVYSVATYATNRLDLSAWREMTKQFVRAGTILGLFMLFEANIVLVTIGSLTMELYFVFSNSRLKRKLLPTYHVRSRNFSFSALKELILSGVWNSIGRASYVLLNDLDLMVANIFINATAMGVLSISKTIPAAINSLVVTVVSIFLPTFTIRYAKSDINGLLYEMHKAIKIIAVCISPVLCFLVAYGKDFYALWQPTQNAEILQLLSVLAIFPVYFTLGMKSVNNVFSVTNKLFVPTIVTLITSVTTILVEFVLLKYTTLGIFAIAATSSVCLLVKEITFIPLYAAKCLGVPWHTFYPQIIKEICIVALSLLVSMMFHSVFAATSWITLIVYGGLSMLLVVACNLLLVLRKRDYVAIRDKVCAMLKHG